MSNSNTIRTFSSEENSLYKKAKSQTVKVLNTIGDIMKVGMKSFYSHQKTCVKLARDVKRGCFYLPTGVGKSLIQCGIILEDIIKRKCQIDKGIYQINIPRILLSYQTIIGCLDYLSSLFTVNIIIITSIKCFGFTPCGITNAVWFNPLILFNVCICY